MGSNHKVGGSNPSRGTKLNQALLNSLGVCCINRGGVIVFRGCGARSSMVERRFVEAVTGVRFSSGTPSYLDFIAR